ncbi:MAG: hypothetical protein IKV63_02495 [Clostridia bacterium]|nr:hypothetical protein [Clostridia bacterium]
MENKLDSILNDPEKMKAAFEMASKIVGQNGASSPPPNIDSNALADTLQKMKSSGALDNILSSLSGKQGEKAESVSDEPEKKNSFADMLPGILQMMGGSANVNSDRANLLRAIKPYVNEGRSGNIDRAVNMAGMAKSAKNAIKGFRR